MQGGLVGAALAARLLPAEAGPTICCGLARLIKAFGQVQIFELHVVGGAVREEGDLFFGQCPHLFDRASYIKKAAFQGFTRWHQAARADNHFVFNYSAIHDRAAHADQDAIADGAAMQHYFVTDGHFVADQQRKTVRVERPGVGDVQHAAVLDAGAHADADAVHVAANDSQRPDRAVGADFNIAQYHG